MAFFEMKSLLGILFPYQKHAGCSKEFDQLKCRVEIHMTSQYFKVQDVEVLLMLPTKGPALLYHLDDFRLAFNTSMCRD